MCLKKSRNEIFKLVLIYRINLLEWKQEMTSRQIPYTDKLNLINMLADTPTITEWNLQVCYLSVKSYCYNS